MRRSALNRNHYFLFGIFVGLVLSFYVPQEVWESVQQEECPQRLAEYNLIEKFGQDFQPHLNLINKPLAAKKPVKNVIRPRYYSSELGIREKVFIGVMTSQDNINTLATAINRTTAHLINKIKFFINADNMKFNYKLKNIVGFTDTRENLRPFHVIKYIADNYLDDYDYFLIISDKVYVDARRLMSTLYHISITFDIYMGTRMESSVSDNAAISGGSVGKSIDDDYNRHDRCYCHLEAGILLSSSVVRKMRNNLDWCVRNGVTNSHGVNIGRCVKYSSNLAGCQQSFQGLQHKTFALNSSVRLFKDLSTLSQNENFRNATTVYPLRTSDDFFRLHAYFSKHHLERVQQRSLELEQKTYNIANGSISNNILEIRWPPGVPESSAPETRHDIIMWHLLNRTHIYLPNGDNIVEPLTRIDSLDLEKVLNITRHYAQRKYPNLKYVDIHTVYRRFDPTRGMDYHIHIKFHDTRHSQRINIKSFLVVKPLGRVEVVPSPYVTESSRIAVLVPTFEHQLRDGIDFIEHYERTCMQNQDNTFLLMIFLYRYDSSSKSDSDPFRSIKSLALDLSTKYKNDGSRIAWVSIRLPAIASEMSLTEDIMLNSLYGRNEILSVAVADLALPKIGLESLVLMASPSIHFKTDYLNRVRMNTLQGFQIYSPIGFMMYPCRFAHFCKECETCDVSQSTGYFDKWNFDVISFYSRDYVQARKLIENSLPIIRNDNDIGQLFTRSNKTINCILDMFIASQLPVHILRGVEPNLRYGSIIKNYLETSIEIPKCPALMNNQRKRKEHEIDEANYFNNYSDEIPLKNAKIKDSSKLKSYKCLHLASRKQIGDAIIRFEDRGILTK